MGLQLPSSDYDIAIELRDDAQMALEDACQVLNRHLPAVSGWVRMPGAHPFIRGTIERNHQVCQVDVCLIPDPQQHHALAASIFVAEVLCKHMVTLKPVVLLLKQLLRACRLTSGQGGLSSYALTLMVAAVMCDAGMEKAPEECALRVLLRFLGHFGRERPAGRFAAVVVVERDVPLAERLLDGCRCTRAAVGRATRRGHAARARASRGASRGTRKASQDRARCMLRLFVRPW